MIRVFTVYSVVGVLLVLVPLITADLLWSKQPVSGDIPSPRIGFTFSALSTDHAILFGGKSLESGWVSSQLYDDLFLYDTKSTTWTLLTSVKGRPSKRHGHTAVEYKGNMYVFGGETKGWSTTQLNDLVEFKLATQSWSSYRCTGRLPPARSYHSAAVIGDFMYIVGGKSSSSATDAMHDAWRLNLETMEWVEIDAAGAAMRSEHAMVAVASRLYAYGGLSPDQHVLSDLSYLDTATTPPAWHHATHAKHARARPTAVMVGTKMIVYGGFDGKSSTNDLQIFDTEMQHWTSQVVSGIAPAPSVFHASTVIGGDKMLAASTTAKSIEVFVLYTESKESELITSSLVTDISQKEAEALFTRIKHVSAAEEKRVNQSRTVQTQLVHSLSKVESIESRSLMASQLLKLIDAVDVVRTASQRVAELSGELNVVKAEMARTLVEQEEVQKTISGRRDEFNRTRIELTNAEKDQQEMMKEFHMHDQVVAQLKTSLVSTQKALDAAWDDLKRKTSQLEEVQAREKDVMDKLSAARRSLAPIDSDIRHIEAQRQEAQHQILEQIKQRDLERGKEKSALAESRRLSAWLVDLEYALTRLELLNVSPTDTALQLKDLERRMSEISNAVSGLKGALETAQRVLEEEHYQNVAGSELEAATNSADHKPDCLCESCVSRRENQKIVARLEAQRNDLVLKLRTKIAEVKSKVRGAQNVVNGINDQVAKHEKAVNNLTEKIAQFEREIDQMTKQKPFLTQQISDLETQLLQVVVARDNALQAKKDSETFVSGHQRELAVIESRLKTFTENKQQEQQRSQILNALKGKQDAFSRVCHQTKRELERVDVLNTKASSVDSRAIQLMHHLNAALDQEKKAQAELKRLTCDLCE